MTDWEKRHSYYKGMKLLAQNAVGYIQEEDEEEPHEYEVSVWVNDTWFDEGGDGRELGEQPRPTVISLEGFGGETQFGFELTAEECLKLSDIIWSELFKRGITREIKGL